MTALTPLIAAGTFRLRRDSARFLARLGLRKPWWQPEDLDRMSWEEREAFFRSLHLDESIAVALAEYRAEKSTSSGPPDTDD